jgi:catechol 2,3-dioxygenase
VPSEAKTPRLRDVGLYHVAFEVPDIHRLKVVFCKLKAKGVPVRPIDHGISKVIYFDDPDGNGIEVYVDTRKETGRREWLGESGPLNLEDE